MKVVTKKNEKEKKGTQLMLNFPLTKSSQQRKTARDGKTSMKSNNVSIVSCVGLYLLDWRKERLLVEALYVS